MTEYNFDLFARYYDLEHGQFEADLGLYKGFAARTGSPILELGCGTGRVLLPLAEAGHEVTGVDVSAAMLDQVRHKLAGRPELADRVRLVQGDARNLDLTQRFGLAFWALNSFMHLATQPDQLRALGSVHGLLRQNGLLILDLFHPDPTLLLEADGRLMHDATWAHGPDDRTVLKYSSRRLDHSQQRLDVTYIYEEMLPGGGTHRLVAPFAMRYLYRFEAELLLERAGFAVEAVYGSYELDEFAADSERMIFVAGKGR